MKHNTRYGIYVIVTLVPFALLLHLISPGIYWGESALITARAWLLGGSHPPGYGGFLTLLHTIQHVIPFGDIPFRSNIGGIFILCFLSLILFLIFDRSGIHHRVAVPASIGFVMMSPVVNASAAVEVYGLHLTLLSLIMATALKPGSKLKNAVLVIFLASIAVTHHLTFVLFLPALPLLFIPLVKMQSKPGQNLVISAVVATLGLSILLYSPVRETVEPERVWGSSDSLQGFLTLVTAAEEARAAISSGVSTTAALVSRAKNIWGVLIKSVTLPGLMLALIGVADLYRKNRLFLSFTLISFLLLLLSVIIYHSNETSSFFLPGILFVWIWAVSGLSRLIERIQTLNGRTWRITANSLTMLPAGALILIILQTCQVRSSDVSIPICLARGSMDSAGDNSITLSRRSDWCFINWYLTDVERRTESHIVFQHLLSFHWYYADLVRNNLITDGMLKNDFQDTFAWNAAMTAAVISQNQKARHVLLVEPELIRDAQQGGLKGLAGRCTIYGFQTGSDIEYRRKTPFPQIVTTGRLDPVSTQAMGALFHRYAECLLREEQLDEFQAAFQRSQYYWYYGLEKGWWN